MISPQWYSIN